MRIGIDLGGTKIAAVVLSDSGERVWDARVATPKGDYLATLDAIADLVGAAERASGERSTIGVGMPGAISPATGLVKNANSTWLNGRPFHIDLERRLGQPVRVANDANCLAVSEAVDGAGAGAAVVFGVILGTGVGGGIAVRGTAIAGANAIAGEWGHNPLPWPDDDERPGPACYCGRHGCLETFLSGPGLAADHERRSGEVLTSEDVLAQAAAGDARAQVAAHTWERRLAKSLATVINLLDPDVIVVGGGLSRAARIYDAVPQLWSRWVFSDHVATKFVPAKFGDASGVRGAAWLWEPPAGFVLP
jgi:fructokinase